MTGKETLSSDGAQEQPDLTTERSSQEPTSSSSSQETPRMTEAEKAAAVANLLSDDPLDEEGQELSSPPAEGGDTGEDTQAPDEAPEGADEAPQPMTLAEAATKLGIEPAELYDLAITTGDGETVTLGDLKDAYQNRTAAQRESAEREAALDSREAQVIADQQVWSVLAATGQLPRGTLEAARNYLADHNSRQTDILMQLVPELQDDAKLDNFRRDMVRVLGEVGLKPQEIALSDHRQALFIRRYIQMERELKALKDASRPQPPKAGKPNGRGQRSDPRSAIVNRARNGTETDKVAAVGHLLRGS